MGKRSTAAVFTYVIIKNFSAVKLFAGAVCLIGTKQKERKEREDAEQEGSVGPEHTPGKL